MSQKAISVHPMDGVTSDWLDRLPRGYHDAYVRARKDPDLLSTQAEVALLHARIGELVTQLDGGGPMHRYQQLVDVCEKMKAALQAGLDMAPLVEALDEIVVRNNDERLIWQELRDIIEGKSKVAAREANRLIQLKQMVPQERVMALIVNMMEIFMIHVPNQKLRLAVARDIEEKIINKDAALGERVPIKNVPHSTLS